MSSWCFYSHYHFMESYFSFNLLLIILLNVIFFIFFLFVRFCIGKFMNTVLSSIHIFLMSDEWFRCKVIFLDFLLFKTVQNYLADRFESFGIAKLPSQFRLLAMKSSFVLVQFFFELPKSQFLLSKKKYAKRQLKWWKKDKENKKNAIIKMPVSHCINFFFIFFWLYLCIYNSEFIFLLCVYIFFFLLFFMIWHNNGLTMFCFNGMPEFKPKAIKTTSKPQVYFINAIYSWQR